MNSMLHRIILSSVCFFIVLSSIYCNFSAFCHEPCFAGEFNDFENFIQVLVFFQIAGEGDFVFVFLFGNESLRHTIGLTGGEVYPGACL